MVNTNSILSHLLLYSYTYPRDTTCRSQRKTSSAENPREWTKQTPLEQQLLITRLNERTMKQKLSIPLLEETDSNGAKQ